jgi:hypothetical protein
MPKRTDRNQPEITRALRLAGASVEHLHEVGKGCADILVGFRGTNYVMEIKDWQQPPSRQRLTPDEQRWHATWQGQVAIIKSVDEALRLIGAIA